MGTKPVKPKGQMIEQNKGVKFDQGKQGWYPLPLEVLRPLADVFIAGEKKYAIFNCLNPFDDPERRFWDSAMRHMEACQLDPLAIDQEIKEKYGIEVYHAAQVAFSMLMRIYNCRNKK